MRLINIQIIKTIIKPILSLPSPPTSKPTTITIFMLLSASFVGLVSLSLVVNMSSVVYAHKPLNSHDNDRFENATVIPNHKISWAIYQQLQGNQRQYYEFNANSGERFYMQMNIPYLKNQETFAPSIAIVGKGLDDYSRIHALNSIVRRANIEELGAAFLNAPTILKDGSTLSAIVFDYNNSKPPKIFYEPFTQTSYLSRQEVIIDHFPSSGKYYLVVFNAIPTTNNLGKYVLAVGDIEAFSLTDYFTTLPAAWFQTKLYFEDYLAVVGAIVLILCIVALLMVIIFHRWKQRRGLRTKNAINLF